MRIGDIIVIQTPALKKPVRVKVLEIQATHDWVVVLDGKDKVHVIPARFIQPQQLPLIDTDEETR